MTPWLALLTASAALPSAGADPRPPCTTRAHPTPAAIAALRPGDVLCLPPGVLPPLRISGVQGREGAPVVIRSSPEARARIRGASLETGVGLHIDGSAHVHVYDLDLSHAQTGVQVDSSAWVRLEGLDVSEVGQAGIAVRRRGDGDRFTGPASHHVDVVGCAIRDTGLDTARYGEGIYLGTGGVDGDDTHHVQVLGNRIADTRAEAVEVKPYTHHVVVADNVIQGGSHFFHGAITVAVQGRVFGDGRYLVARNRIHGFRTTGGLVGGIVVGHGTTWVIDNLVWDVDGAGIRTTTTFADPVARDVRLIGNTVWCPGRCPSILLDQGDERTGRRDGLGAVTASGNHTHDGATGSAVLDPSSRRGPLTGEADAGDGPGSGFEPSLPTAGPGSDAP